MRSFLLEPLGRFQNIFRGLVTCQLPCRMARDRHVQRITRTGQRFHCRRHQGQRSRLKARGRWWISFDDCTGTVQASVSVGLILCVTSAEVAHAMVLQLGRMRKVIRANYSKEGKARH